MQLYQLTLLACVLAAAQMGKAQRGRSTLSAQCDASEAGGRLTCPPLVRLSVSSRCERRGDHHRASRVRLCDRCDTDATAHTTEQTRSNQICTMAAASSSAPGPATPAWCTGVTRATPPLLFRARMRTAELMAASPPVGFHRVRNKDRIWKLIRSRRSKDPEADKADAAKLLRVARYDSRSMPMDAAAVLTTDTQFTIVPSVYGYEAPSDPSEFHFWTNFADKHLFAFYASDLFAQDEWQCMEIPALCSLREWMDAHSKADGNAAPLTVQGGNPTPVIVMNAPREVNIDAVGHKIYGNAFSVASTETIDAATTLLPRPVLSHIIAMEALKHRHGAYTSRDIALTLQTAITAFKAAVVEASLEFADRKLEGQGLAPKVVIHTGNWGCGAFGGNVEIMCLLQMIAARVAGVENLVYHVLSADNEATCKRAVAALGLLMDKLRAEAAATPPQQPNLMEIASYVAGLNYKWGLSNGT